MDEGYLFNNWKARDINGDRGAVIKFLKQNNEYYRIEDLLRFKNNSQFLCSLNHSNLLQTIEVGDYNGFSYLVTEDFKGISLLEYLKNEKQQ